MVLTKVSTGKEWPPPPLALPLADLWSTAQGQSVAMSPLLSSGPRPFETWGTLHAP